MRLGEEVGYQIRLDQVCSAKTRIRFVTEGVLLRQMLADPRAARHQRHRLRRIPRAASLRRHHARPRARSCRSSAGPICKLIVMSATLDAGALQKYLAPCELLTSRGRTFPVDIEYLDKPLGDCAGVGRGGGGIRARSRGESEGDVLVFMPGAYEISRTIQAIRNTRAGSQCLVLPLHGELPAARAGRRGRALRAAQGHRLHQRRGDFADDRRRARRHRQRAGEDRALRSVSRHQYAARRAHLPRQRRSARRPRGPHRAGPLPAALDGARASRPRRRRSCPR